jgi:hypothetical protein
VDSVKVDDNGLLCSQTSYMLIISLNRPYHQFCGSNHSSDFHAAIEGVDRLAGLRRSTKFRT